MVASMTLDNSFFTQSLVPLHSLGASIFLSNIIGDPTFRVKLFRSLCSVVSVRSGQNSYCSEVSLDMDSAGRS
jgi:hypothetical protein